MRYAYFFIPVCFIFLLFITIVLFLRLQGAKIEQKQKNLVVLCTTNIIADAVRSLGGSVLTVISLMGPGVDPHLYRMKQADIYAIKNADIIFYNGLHLEGKIVDILASLPNAIAVSDALEKKDLIAVNDSVDDPHIWHSVRLWQKVVAFITHLLKQHDSTHSAWYERANKQYQEKLDELHTMIKQKFDAIEEKRRILITAHDAFSYFGREYCVKVVGLQGISTEVEIGTHDIKKLADFIVENRVKTIFVETSIPQRTMNAVQAAVTAQGHTIAIGNSLFSDALGDNASGGDTYITMMKHNVDAIAGGLW